MTKSPLLLRNVEVLFSNMHNDFITAKGKNLGRSLTVRATDELLDQITADPRVKEAIEAGFTDLNLKERKDKDGNSLNENTLTLRLKPFKSGQRPQIVDKANQATLEEASFMQKVNISVFPGTYENTFKGGAKSISLKVIGVQLLDKPELGSVNPGFVSIEEPSELNL